MREHKRIGQEALDNLAELARLTKNFSGAEIEGLVKSAASFAFQRNVNVKDVRLFFFFLACFWVCWLRGLGGCGKGKEMYG